MTKFDRLYTYLETLKVEEVQPIMTTDNNDATSCLATASGVRILIARPEVKISGSSDVFASNMGTLFFVLEKGLGPANTKAKENDQYSRLRVIVDSLLSKLEHDVTSGTCTLLSGLDISSVEIIPVIAAFGGWLGYSVEVEFV